MILTIDLDGESSLETGLDVERDDELTTEQLVEAESEKVYIRCITPS